MPFTHRVRRPWGGKNPVKSGQLVDASGYRNLTQLEKLLYITPLTETEAAEANAMPPTDDPLKEHVIPVPDELRAPRAPDPAPKPTVPAVEAPPPADQRPAMPDRDKEPGPPKDQRPARTDINKESGPPKGQEPARTPNDQTVSRDDAEEDRRRGGPPAPADQSNNPPVLDPERSRVQDHLGEPLPRTPRRRLPE